MSDDCFTPDTVYSKAIELILNVDFNSTLIRAKTTGLHTVLSL